MVDGIHVKAVIRILLLEYNFEQRYLLFFSSCLENCTLILESARNSSIVFIFLFKIREFWLFSSEPLYHLGAVFFLLLLILYTTHKKNSVTVE